MKVLFSVKGITYKPNHGPQTWPWWRVVTLSLVRLEVRLPTTAYGLWAYTRWGAKRFDVFFDRRPVSKDAL